MSEFCPPGVKYFDHKASSSKGKFHPAGVNTGFEDVTKISGTPPKVTKDFVAKAKSRIPAGVSGDGTKNVAAGKHMQAPVSHPIPGVSMDKIPSGVRKHSGVSAPKKRK